MQLSYQFDVVVVGAKLEVQEPRRGSWEFMDETAARPNRVSEPRINFRLHALG